MDKLLIGQFFKHQAFVKYALTGAVVTAGELGLLYWLVDYRGWWYLIASSLVFFLGLVTSFVLRKIFVFRNYDRHCLGRQIFFYSVVWLIDLILNFGLMYLLVSQLGIKYLVAQIISNAGLGIFGFIFNKLVTFKTMPRAGVHLQHHQLIEEIKK